MHLAAIMVTYMHPQTKMVLGTISKDEMVNQYKDVFVDLGKFPG